MQVYVRARSHIGRRGCIEARPAPFATVSAKSKLRDYQEGALNFLYTAIHSSLFVREYPQVDNLIGKIVRVRVAIVPRNSKNDEQSSFYASHACALHLNPRLFDSLQHNLHTVFSIALA